MTDRIPEEEVIVRLLFSHRMTNDDGQLTTEVFPMEELIEKKGKSVSVDRLSLLPDQDCIQDKLSAYENPSAARAKWGFCTAIVGEVRSIHSQCGQQVFDVFNDPIESSPPAPWDKAHAKTVRASTEFGKAFVRGYRDQLIEVFQNNVVRLF